MYGKTGVSKWSRSDSARYVLVSGMRFGPIIRFTRNGKPGEGGGEKTGGRAFTEVAVRLRAL